MTIMIGVLFFVVQLSIIGFLSTRAQKEKIIERVIEHEVLSEKAQIKQKKKAKVKVKKIDLMLKQADLKLSSVDAIFIYSILMIVGLFSGYIINGTIFGSLIMMIVVHIGCIGVLKTRSKKRIKRFESQLGDAIQVISNAMKAGYSFFQALSRVVEESSDPISSAFAQIIKEMSLGKSVDQVLDQLVRGFPIEDLELMVTAILIQREIGGNLSEILDNILETIRERQRINNEVRTLTAQGKLSGAIVMGMPIVIGAILYFMNPEYIMLLFETFLGRVMLGVAFSNQIMGALLIKKIITIEY
jgi:tight adherence protein B